MKVGNVPGTRQFHKSNISFTIVSRLGQILSLKFTAFDKVIFRKKIF